jgi:hypothetical protein
MFFALRHSNTILRSSTRFLAFFGFYYDVVDVGLYGWPDVFPKNVLHASLVRSPCVPETEGRSNVAIHVEQGDE